MLKPSQTLGFSGIYQLYLARSAGFEAKVVERGSDVGGTWYWNRYPGAMSDTEAYVYRYSFDKDHWLTADLPDHYAKQPHSFAYLKQVVEKHGLRKDMEFDVDVNNTSWSEQDQKWYTTTSKGTFVSKYLITGLGLLTTPYWPDIPGLKSFKREIYHTSRFPWDWDFSGKRVGVIGNGSTGIQVITQLGAEKKVKSLVSFQRNPQYTVPSGDRPMTKEERAELCSDYEGTWQKVKNSKYGFGEIAAPPPTVAKPDGCLTGFEESTTSAMSVSPEKRQQMFEESWSKGNGFRFLDTFSDITTNLDANVAAAEFIKGKIRQIVRNPDTARKLMPNELYFRRPLCDAGYYQVFNEDWVELVSLAETPIDTITATGIKTSDGVERELDVLIVATGFSMNLAIAMFLSVGIADLLPDGVDGSYNSIHFEGRHGDTLKEHWSPRSRSYLGLMVSNFPNLFMIAGPLGPFCSKSILVFLFAAVCS